MSEYVDYFSSEELSQWTQLYAQDIESENGKRQGREWLLFRLGSARFAVPMDDLDEVASVVSGSVLPNASAIIQGLTNLRGDVLLLLSLSHVLGWHAKPGLRVGNCTLVCKDRQGQRTGFLVDSILGVACLDEAAFQPYRGPDNQAAVVHGLGEYDGKPLLLLSLPATVEAALNKL